MLKIAWSSIYAHPLPSEHRFPMEKYNLIPEQLLFEGTIKKENLFEPSPLKDDAITAAHEAQYLERLKTARMTSQEMRRIGFPYSKELVNREILIMGGTLECALFSLQSGVAMNIAGGTHHAFTDKGEGFCLLNDIAIATQYLIDHETIKKVLIVDLDVHQGNGTAQIFFNRPDVFTFSMHGINNFPAKKEKSTLDIALPDHTNDIGYLKILQENLGRIIDEFQPEFIFYQSGVDVLESDKLGKLSLSIQGCKERDQIVLEAAKRAKIPVTVAMGGGYSERISIIIEAHANTFRLAQEIFF